MRIRHSGNIQKNKDKKPQIPAQVQEAPRILLRRKHRLGDMVMCAALANYIRGQHKNVTVATLPAYRSFLMHIDPPIAYENYEVYDSSKYDEVIELNRVSNNSFPGEMTKQMMFFATAGIDPNHFDDSIFVPRMFVKEEHRTRCRSKLKRSGLESKTVLIAIKSYNVQSPRSAEIEDLFCLHDGFGDYNFIVASKDPIDCPQWQRLHNWATNTPSLDDLIALIGAVDLVVAVDTGIMHIASAMGKPVLAIFGPTRPMYLARHYRRMVVIDANRDCAPCWDHGCDTPCLGKLPDTTMVEAFDLLLSGYDGMRIVDFDGNILGEISP